MKLLLVFLFSLMVSILSFMGEARAGIFRAYLLNPEIRYDRGSNQDLEMRKPFNISVGYQFKRWSALLEYSRFDDSSQVGNYYIERQHQEVMLWARYHCFAWTFGGDQQTVQGYVGFGAGGFRETVYTVFQSEGRKDSGGIPFMSGVATGVEYSLRLDKEILLTAALEGRTLVAADFDPNPVWGAVLRLGLGMFF